MSVDHSEVLESTNISDSTLIIEKPCENNESVGSKENNGNPEKNIFDSNGEVLGNHPIVPGINDERGSDYETEDLENSFARSKNAKKLAIFDSDSENDDKGSNIRPPELHSGNEDGETQIISNKKSKRIAFIDSDSEHENEDNSNKDPGTNEVVEYKSVDQSDTIEQNELHSQNQKKILSTLCDSESSDENNEEDQEKEEGDISDTEKNSLPSNEIIPKSKRRKNKQETGDKEKMTVKKALEQRKEINAESQRRVRESRVSLPYHKPKPRSLKEFLQNRPKLAAPLSDVSRGGSPSLSIKMSMKQLEIITQKMKEREKEMEEFYKSESESEHEEEVSIENPETINAISSPSKTEENQEDDSSINPLINQENIPQEKLEDGQEIIDDTTNSNDNKENSIENIKDQEMEETSEKLQTECTKSTELLNLKENEKYIDLKPEESTESDNNAFIDAENFETKIEVTENEPIVCKETDGNLKKNANLILLSDVLVMPPKSGESTKIYNLNAELLELASEVEKDGKDQYDSYEFNLDGIEDDYDLVAENGGTVKKGQKTEGEWKKRRSEILRMMGELKPRLSIGPNQVIDLEKGVAMPDDISRLRERFIKHNLKSEKHSHKKEISIVSVADGQIHKETLSLKLGDNEDEDMMPLEKPGVRLQKLRKELKHQIAQRRSDLWNEKRTNRNKNEKLIDGEDKNEEKSESDMKDILDDEEEEDFTDPEEEDNEELEENDYDMSEKKRVKSDFVDGEAEESESEEIGDGEDLLNENEEGNESDEIDEKEEDADVEDNEDIVDESEPKKKVMKRIIKPFDEDSDDESESNQLSNLFETLRKNKKINTESDDENLLPSLQPTNFRTREPLLSPEKSEEHFATPVTYMTGLKNLNTSGSRFVPPENIMEDDEALRRSKIHEGNNEKMEKSQVDSQDVHSYQMAAESSSLSTQDVNDICSGQFPCISSPEISTQQLREVFTGSMKSSIEFDTQDVDDICSGGFTGLSQTAPVQEKEIALDDNDEHLISQLIDEDELENFKKKFESPGVNSNINSSKQNTFEEVEEVVGAGGVIGSDDDDETELKLKNRKRKRLAFSDDEDSSTSVTLQEETIDLQDDEGLASNVEYDSEENEIENEGEKVPSEVDKKEKMKASDFFEQEAELSESEWGSEDEDERNLDDLEFEKGDEENFDEDQLRTDIEKIQMRQMLDEDNREVKMLQELLLEDGELHGSGRQRQFRWKNIDAAINDSEEKKDEDDDVYLDEDESEEQWRKERHKREMLKLKQQSQEEDSLIIENQSLSFTHKSLKIKSQSILGSQVSSSEVDSSPKIKQPFALLNKRGSFLSRGEKILQKIAETSKVSFTAKNTNRIVFKTIDEDTKKRKASSANLGDSTPVALKKLRLSGLSPGLNKDRSKVGKSLFDKILQH